MVRPSRSLPRHRNPARRTADVRLEPLPRLEWSLLTEASPSVTEAAAPASLRRDWISCAPQEQVLSLFRRLTDSGGRLPAPWWLVALERGELPSRAAAFALEDAVHGSLSARPGWVFVPWAGVGESGYWEYGPSDRGLRTMPTTVVMTHRHPGWVDVVPARTEAVPARPVAVDGVSGLETSLPRAESW